MHNPTLFRVAIIAASLAVAASTPGFSQQLADANTAAAETVSIAYTPPPPPPNAAELSRLRSGLSAVESSDWLSVASARDQAVDPIVRRLLQWRYASAADAPLNFDDIAQALTELQGWPGRANMRSRAEQAIFTSRLTPAERIAFLRQDGGPVSGDGKIALAQALRQAGQREEASEIARAAWREDNLSPAAESVALDTFGSVFSQDDHAARVDILVWRGQRSAAQRLYPRISSADRLLAEARIALQTRQRRGLQAAVDAVPASRRDNAGLLYDRARYMRRDDRPEDALPVAARIDGREAPLAARDEIAEERRLYVARALRAGNHRTAYSLVTNHGLTSGAEFADAEWMAGWISLRFLDRDAQAREHFSHLSQNVSSPVSLSRAYYWSAEAARAMGQSAEANAEYERAANYPFTYYGQLAAARLDRRLSLPEVRITDEARGRFDNRELVRALRVLAEVGTPRDYEGLAFYLDDTLDDPQEIELLAQLSRERVGARTATRNAKAGLFRNVVAPNSAYPLLDLPSSVDLPGRPERALVLAIIRQESEFDARAVSHANAHGLMQLIPTTAQATARRTGMTYQRASLTSDPDYNVSLGSAYLGQLIDDWGGSYVLAIASYNAGPNAVRRWIGDWGDPRTRGVNTIDWIELIPYSETRNYVQRVLENTQVYRYRLANEPTPIALERDLERGG